jgi:probable F420-dependent oxidoreductase
MSSLRPFRFSTVMRTAKSSQEWIDKAHRAEDLGYTTLLMVDHFYSEMGPVVGLMSVAQETSLRIGCQVFCNDYRHPIVLARQAANLDLLSNGRFQFGLGCGYLAEEYQQVGIPLDPPGIRIARFEEAIHIIKAYFQQDEVHFAGRYYTIDGIKAVAKAVQKPHPPIYMGGGSKRVLSIAAREANIVGLGARTSAKGLDWSSALLDANLEKITWIRLAAEERFHQLELSSNIFIIIVTENQTQVAQQVGNRLGLTAEQTLQCLHVLIGTADQISEELEKRRQLLGISSIEVLEEHMEAFAPVVARLAGKQLT